MHHSPRQDGVERHDREHRSLLRLKRWWAVSNGDKCKRALDAYKHTM